MHCQNNESVHIENNNLQFESIQCRKKCWHYSSLLSRWDGFNACNIAHRTQTTSAPFLTVAATSECMASNLVRYTFYVDLIRQAIGPFEDVLVIAKWRKLRQYDYIIHDHKDLLKWTCRTRFKDEGKRGRNLTMCEMLENIKASYDNYA